MPDHIIKHITSSISRIEGDRESAINLAQEFIREGMTIKDIFDIITQIGAIEDELNRKDVISCAREFIDKKTSVENINGIIFYIRKIKGDRKESIKLVKKFIKPSFHPSEIKIILSSVRDIKGDVEDTINKASEFIRSDMSCTEIQEIISAIGGITVDREDAINCVRRLISNYPFKVRRLAHLISAIGGITVDREDVINRAQEFFRQDGFLDEYIKAIGSIIGDREGVINLARQFINQDTDESTISRLIAAIGNITVHRDEAVNLMQQLNSPDINVWDTATIISSIGKITNNRREIIDLTRQFIRPRMREGYISVIIDDISRCIDNQPNRIARALIFMRGGDYRRSVLEKALSTPLDDEIIDGDMAAIAQHAQNPYAAGINAHADGRDERVVAATHSLYATWNPTPAELDAAYADFLRAVKKLDKVRQARVLRSLGIDQNGHVLPKPAHETFSGLVSGVDESGKFVLSGNNESMRVNGREIVARFWHFANTYDEHEHTAASSLSRAPSSETIRDRQNMREGIIDALVRGVNEHNTLRCEPGRVQLLELATLQGRLRGADGRVVDVDNLGLNPEVPLAGGGMGGGAEFVVDQAEPALITNLDEIAHYLQPFVNGLGAKITTADQFYMELFRYINRLADGGVMAGAERIRLDPASVVYFVRMMEPAVVSGGRIRVPARINPHASLVALFGFDNAFRIDDYERQFGARDRAQFEAAQTAARARIELEQRRALVAQQDREYAADVAEDLERQKYNRAATEIQRIARGSSARKDVQVMREQAVEQARVQAERMAKFRAEILAGTAGAITADADMLNALLPAERTKYTQLRRVHQLSK